MARSNPIVPFIDSIPQVLPPKDRALAWVSSVCFHTLALTVASVAAVSLREVPPAPAPVARLEILLTDAQHEATQLAAVDSPAQTAPTTVHETAAPTEDTSPIVPASPSSTVQRTLQRASAETPPPTTTNRSTETRDQVPVESAEPVTQLSEQSTSVTEPGSSTPSSPTEAVEQVASTTGLSSPSESLEHMPVETAESSSQQEASSSPPIDTTPTTKSDAQTDAADSPTTPPTESVAMPHPAMTGAGPSKSDYAWLTDLLRRRIIRLQTYPHAARAQGWEGVVVVKTTINSEGDLIDAVVTKSSGYEALDEEAVKLMRRVCPVRLTQDLGKPKIAVMIPIRYRLDGFEQ